MGLAAQRHDADLTGRAPYMPFKSRVARCRVSGSHRNPGLIPLTRTGLPTWQNCCWKILQEHKGSLGSLDMGKAGGTPLAARGWGEALPEAGPGAPVCPASWLSSLSPGNTRLGDQHRPLPACFLGWGQSPKGDLD
ncbi:MAG: hypothetical protein FRX49_02323 [Trebouxia sp. A1-2]|nr:MAG: hypothetical protein FRX49_02323 [Trebouxia sp. A1-2]